MLSKQMLESPMTQVSDAGDAGSEVVPSGMYLATVAIGMAPAIATVGFFAGAGLLAVAGSACLLGAGLITAVLSVDH
jgi:hypothetical protein